MIASRDVQKFFRNAAWASSQEIDAFVADVGALPTGEMLKLLAMLLDKALVADIVAHKKRCAAFAALGEQSPDQELFVPGLRALKTADAALRAMLVALLPLINNVAAHGELCLVVGAPDADVRRAAADVLRQVGGKTALQILTDYALDPSFSGRMETMDVFVPKAGHHAITLLSAVIEGGKPLERAQALRYLGDARYMAKDVAAALQAIALALEDADERVRCQAIVALSALAREDDYYRLLGPLLDAPSLPVQKAVVEGTRGFPTERSIGFLTKKFRLGPSALRLTVLETLDAMGNDLVLPLLVEALSHKQLAVRTKAAEVLSSLSLGGKVDVASTILWLLRSREVNVRRLAVEIAKKVGDPSGELAPKLLRFLRDEDWWVRERVMDALVEMSGHNLTRHIVDYLHDPSDVARRYAIGALVRLGDPRSLGALVRSAMNDPDWWVREQAIGAVAHLKDGRALPYLLEVLTLHPDQRLVCIEALGALGSKDAASTVAEYLGDEDPDVRLAALECLEQLDDRSHAGALQRCEADEVFRVRNKAREIATRWQIREQNEQAMGDEAKELLDRLLLAVSQVEADDLVLGAGRPAFVKKHGKMAALTSTAFSQDQLVTMLFPHLTLEQQSSLGQLCDIDFSYEVKSHDLRFRAHVFAQMSGLGAVFRNIKSDIPEIEKLGLPPVVRSFGSLKNGLVLVGGPTGSGKSTTLAALVDYINRTSARHIVTIEDPIEFVHRHNRSLVTQREAGSHTLTFDRALRAAMRQDPDVILVGEMRDLATISFAVTAAETGHLVLGTVHTVSADLSIDRLVNVFPAGQQPQIRAMLADTLRAVVCQHLLRRKDGEGRALAAEVLVNTDAVSNLIRKGKAFQIPSVIATSRDQGMQSMDSELVRLLRENKIGSEEAYLKAVDKSLFDATETRASKPSDIKLGIQSVGARTTAG